jgi:hypothetical protein
VPNPRAEDTYPERRSGGIVFSQSLTWIIARYIFACAAKGMGKEDLMTEVAGSTELSKEALLDAYRTMRTIREFEERLHTEFATGEIPGFVHPPGARPLHRQGLRRQGDDA